MTIITTILDFLLITWIFWPIILTLPFIAYYNVISAIKDDESEIFAGFLIVAIVSILAYKFPALRGYFDGWRAILTVAGGYLAAGFLLSLYKWFSVLWDFRKRDIKGIVQDAKGRVSIEKNKHANSIDDDFTEGVINYIVGNYYTRGDSSLFVEFDKVNEQYTIYPNWKKYPIGMWWAYWPFFLLELPFDFIKRLAERLFDWLRHFYNGIAKKFSVKVKG